MQKKIIETKWLPIAKIKKNTGQVQGLPANPRVIKDSKFKKLQNSIKENPEMLSLRELLVFPVGKEYITIGGNMRLEAMKVLGYNEAPCKVLPADTSVENLKAYTIKDNSGFGEWDFSMLANEWEAPKLNDWGLDVWQEPVGNPFEPSGDSIETMIEQADDAPFDPTNLPEELQGIDLTPDDIPKIGGTDETAYERVIIVYKKEQKEQLSQILGLTDIAKVVYSLDEILAKNE